MRLTKKQIIAEGKWTDWKVSPDKQEYISWFVIKGAGYCHRVSVSTIKHAFQLLPKQKKEEENG